MKTHILFIFLSLGILFTQNVQAFNFSEFNNQIQKEESIKVFPNPVKNVATLQITLDKNTDLQIEFFDLSGKKVKEIKKESQQKGTQTIKADVSNFNEGIYFCRITTNNWIKAKRILVRK